MERPDLDAWLREADEVLRDEGIVLEGLKQAVERNSITQQELDENMGAYHKARTTEVPSHLICPDVSGRDL